MNETLRKLSDRFREIDKEIVRALRNQQVTQSFDGSLRVDPDKVYISRSESRRAIEALRKRVG